MTAELVNGKWVYPLKPDAKVQYGDEAECPRVAIPLVDGNHRYHDPQLHDWRCIHTPDGLVWYCTRCRKTSRKQVRQPAKQKAGGS